MSKTVRISEFLHRRKETVVIKPDAEYNLVTVKMHHKGVVLREKKRGSQIGSTMFRILKGQFILSGIDARNGAFGIVPDFLDGAIITNDFWCFDVDEAVVKRDFFYWLTNTPLFLDACIKSSKGETQRVRLQKDLFFDFKFHIPSLDEQGAFLERIEKANSGLAKLNHELHNQSDNLAKLRQTLLQESIEGKLTAEWRKQNPELISGENHASNLLEKVRLEKVRLIKEGKTRKEKPFPLISDNEKPFILPNKWVWCRLGEVISYSDNLDIQRYLKSNDVVNYVDIDSIDNQSHSIREVKERIVAELSSRARRVLHKGYIVYSTVRPYLNNIAIIEDERKNYIGSTGFCVFTTIKVDKRYIFNFLLSSYVRSRYLGLLKGFNSPTITNEQFEATPVPIPPLSEQKAILEKVDGLLSKVDELNKQVAERKEQAELLMQSVLYEAFEYSHA